MAMSQEKRSGVLHFGSSYNDATTRSKLNVGSSITGPTHDARGNELEMESAIRLTLS